ncbi:hypothetical protein MJO28_002132 [Puccinia striiformis f. sp. tritici]|uniref:Secreted protein n=4 Tax=Puccinia striiformis TaxID=27350 RepID=A0A0L0W329_9BASI|nr:hypothetical protein MJO28_002132 [Puccinia striiformis f. sp. tritici]KAI9610078.1 hypothetical protein H4Q26_007075 [Puccinia striiformis f. sp. tritici PST-130]KNF05948.1 hypothetical protein PSTG_00940 [Puccinia striiformis f. sp. tritici PST-78]POW12574.1 hypothetical protein PSTT_04271 [Puccinia striiformis]KAI7966461.1 hypothetical protein MJO29_002209 [Puccinia striiformis f. sp. tritici]
MLSLKSTIVFTILACGFAAADLKADQKKYCTFSCGIYSDEDLTEGGCTTITNRDKDGTAIQWTMKEAFRTDNHAKYFNCLGTDAAFSSCCKPGSIKIPPGTKGKPPPVMTLNGPKSYSGICKDASPTSSEEGDPEDCLYNP